MSEELADFERGFLHQLGERLRELRRNRGLTLGQLAEQAGVTTGFISQLENGKNSPSLMTLRRITEALGVPFSDLFAPEPAPETDRYIIRRSDRKRITIPGLRQQLYRLTPGGELEFESLLNILPPGVSTTDRPVSHHGGEWFYVLEGAVELSLGSVTYALEAGDCAAFPSSVPHQVTNRGSVPAQVIWVNSPRQFT